MTAATPTGLKEGAAMHASRIPTVAMLVCAATVSATGHAGAAPACGVNLHSDTIIRAVRSLRPYPGTDWAWSTNPASFTGNFSPCATLSTALVSVEAGTGSSPVTALMFHDGNYLGTATAKAYGFTSLNTARTTDDTVVLNYKTPGACNACAPAAINSVRYQWQGDHVVMLDPAPPG